MGGGRHCAAASTLSTLSTLSPLSGVFQPLTWLQPRAQAVEPGGPGPSLCVLWLADPPPRTSVLLLHPRPGFTENASLHACEHAARCFGVRVLEAVTARGSPATRLPGEMRGEEGEEQALLPGT